MSSLSRVVSLYFVKRGDFSRVRLPEGDLVVDQVKPLFGWRGIL